MRTYREPNQANNSAKLFKNTSILLSFLSFVGNSEVTYPFV